MKLLLDAKLSPEVARLSKQAGHDVIHVRATLDAERTRPEILRAAAKEERVLLPADANFGPLLALGSLGITVRRALAFCRSPAPCRASKVDRRQSVADHRRSSGGSDCRIDAGAPVRSRASDGGRAGTLIGLFMCALCGWESRSMVPLGAAVLAVA